ncbi:ABC transporter ATP-binding protein [Glaciihabitans sp. dw_435]|uniref:ABC transporter ATP-binding protein n=1 Tax=Glaciihabitans sp. dw_435 TaxID=2720081 RepID=UPI001BD2F204|nr:ABC transporter ATP-binding protein [Glaciihabitans sp. dw_435]
MTSPDAITAPGATGTAEPTAPLLRAVDLGRVFSTRAGDVVACANINLEVYPGELVVVRGPSGAGKSTLLGMLGGLDTPTSGEVWVEGRQFSSLTEQESVELRRGALSFIFQSFGLIPVLTAAENVELPLRITNAASAERDLRVAEVLAMVGLSDHAAQLPSELSGGQQQRVGIARALAVPPRILIADEPTAQLDSTSAALILDLISGLVISQGLAAVVATHDADLSARADRVIELHDGRATVQSPARTGRHASPVEPN